MNTRTRSSAALLSDERGLSTVEYVIVLMLIAIVGIISWQKFGGAVASKAHEAKNEIRALSGEAPARVPK